MKLDEIAALKQPWGRWAVLFSYLLVGTGVTALLSGSWWDLVCAAILSLLVFGMVQCSRRIGCLSAEWLPFVSTFVSAVLALSGKHFVPEINAALVILASIAVLLPGYKVALGIVELVGQHTVSGMANLMSGLVYLFKQGAGAWAGVQLVQTFWPLSFSPFDEAIHSNWLYLFIPFLIVGLGISAQTSHRDFIWACLCCSISYAGILVGSSVLNHDLGNLLGTIIAVVMANFWAQKKRRPAAIVLRPSVILLVTGGVGFQGLEAFAVGHVKLGEHNFIQMFVVALTIAAGLFIGNSFVRSDSTL